MGTLGHRSATAVIVVFASALSLGASMWPAGAATRAPGEPVEAVRVVGHGEVGKVGKCSETTGHRKPHRCLKFAYDITRHDTGAITGELTIECPRRHVAFHATAFPELSIARFTALVRATGVLDDGRTATADIFGAANDELMGTTDEFGVMMRTASRSVCDQRGTLALGDIDEPMFAGS